jgi:hypothetical protein
MIGEASGDPVPAPDPMMSRIRRGSRIATYMVGNVEAVASPPTQMMPTGENKRKLSRTPSFILIEGE